MKQTIVNNFSRQFLGLGIACLMIFSAIGCSQTKDAANGNSVANSSLANSNTTVIKTDSIPTNNNSDTVAPNSESSKAGQKATAIVGKWETTTAMDDKIVFDFGPSKKEGETYVGTYTFYVNDTNDPPAKYVVSGDKMIRFFNKEGKEYPLIKVSVSDDGKSLTYFDQKDGESKLKKTTAANLSESNAPKGDQCRVIDDNTDYFVDATEKTIKLKKGTIIVPISFEMHQGLYEVNANVNGKWVRGEINYELIDCPDEK